MSSVKDDALIGDHSSNTISQPNICPDDDLMARHEGSCRVQHKVLSSINDHEKIEHHLKVHTGIPPLKSMPVGIKW
jgi:hypothetical protein